MLKSLSNRQNQRHPEPSADDKEKTPTSQHREENVESTKRHREDEEGCSDNVSNQHKTKRQKSKLQGEFKKFKPSLFEGESEEATKAWLINMGKYFQIYEYTDKLNADLAVYQLRGKATLWQEEIKTVRKIDEQQVTWNEFQKHFKDKYLSKRYYDEKANEFHELRLRALTMDDYVDRFTSLLHYVPYMQEEKAKIQRFTSSLPKFMKEKLELDYPKTMDDAVQKSAYVTNK